MKTYARFLALAAVALLAAAPAAVRAQTYPTSSPGYTPTAQLAPVTLTGAGNVYFTAQNTGAVLVNLQGNNTALAATVAVSNDAPSIADASKTWTTVLAVPVAGGVPVSVFAVKGTWLVPVQASTRVRVNVTSITGTNVIVTMTGGTAGLNALDLSAITVDPCRSSLVVKQSAVISQTSGATTKIVDASGTKSIYVCGFVASLSGTTPTVSFTSGTHTSADCDTTAAVLSGVFTPTAGSVLSYGPGVTAFKTAAGFQLCATTGATSSIYGILTYVQQ
jgi:hypothetical protein